MKDDKALPESSASYDTSGGVCETSRSDLEQGFTQDTRDTEGQDKKYLFNTDTGAGGVLGRPNGYER